MSATEESRRIAALEARVRALEAENSTLRRGQRKSGAVAIRGSVDRRFGASARFGIWIRHVVDGSVYWSKEMFHLLGLDPAVDRASLDAFDRAIHPDDLADVRAATDEVAATGRPPLVDIRIVLPDGSVREVTWGGTMLFDDEGRPSRMIGAIVDMTDMRSTQRALIRTADMLEAAQRVARVGSWHWDARAGVIHWSDELYEIFGLPHDVEPTEARFFEAIHPLDRERVRRVHVAARELGEVPHGLVFRIVRADGEVRHVESTGTLLFDALAAPAQDVGRVGRLGTISDITQRIRLEAQLRQSHKMEAVGRLAGGLAHDFNNALMVIMGNAELLEANFPSTAASHIKSAARSAAGVTRQLLAFSRQSVLRPDVHDLNRVVIESRPLITRLVHEDVHFATDLGEALWPVQVDFGQLQQVLMNLAANARDAMPDGGELRVRTRNVRAAPANGEGVRAVDHVAVEISDTGHGMDEETQSRIFEPFFTTKGSGRGTGLGLSMVYGIVTQTGGEIDVDSMPDAGAVFTMRFPRAVEDASLDGGAGEPSSVERQMRIALVEDAIAVRDLLATYLRSADHVVMSFPSPDAALAALGDGEAEVDLLVSDVVMPGMSGLALHARLLVSRPELRALFISGYAPGDIGPSLTPDQPFLAKPFTRVEFLDAVARALDDD